MAKIVLAAPVGAISGSIGGQTYGHNRSGPYIRRRAIPTNPNTAAQQAVRENLDIISKNWKDCTDEQRAGWTALGAQIPRTDSNGSSYTLTGFMAHQLVNGYRLLLGEAYLATAPGLDTPPPINSLLGTFDTAPTVELVVTSSSPAAAERWVVLATGPHSQGVGFFGRSKYKLMATFAGNVAAGTMDISAEWQAAFGAPITGQKISCLVFALSVNRLPGATVRVDLVAP